MASPDIMYSSAKEQYEAKGIDVDGALARMARVPLSVHCWQGDDVGGFEKAGAELGGGGIQVTGNYPGKARTIDELRKDLEKMYSLLPGNHRLALHAIYGEFGGATVDRDAVAPEHFRGWADWSKQNNVPLDFNSSFFSHPKADDGFTLSSKDEGIRSFWIEHAIRCREISDFLGGEQGNPCIHNIWIPDGMKDYPVDRMGYRKILADSLDKILEKDLSEDRMKDAVECKLFGIGSEAYVVGSHEFYMGYALTRNKMICIDMGHFHPTELIADKISSILLFNKKGMMLHVSRCMRWDSDHVVLLNDDIRLLFEELVRSGGLDNTAIGLDFFDGSINRLGAWALGARSALKGLLLALLQPTTTLLGYEENGNYFERLALQEEMKSMPFGVIWDNYCISAGVPTDAELIDSVAQYEKQELVKRA